MTLPEFLHPFFWEYKPETIDIVKHAPVIMARIMERGSWASMIWLRKTYSKKQIKEFLLSKGKTLLPARELNYWLLISDIPRNERKKLVKAAKSKRTLWREHAH